jgi:hypothetical protein
MPWFPDFVSATELARRQSQIAGRTDPVTQYLQALEVGSARGLETIWPGTIVIEDPRAGTVRGHRRLREFVRRNRTWLTGLHATTEPIASTSSGQRAVVELLAHLDDRGQRIPWPIAVVAESPDDRSVLFRTYCSQWPVDGHHHVRPPILEPGEGHLEGVVGRHVAALAAGDVQGCVQTFTATGYLRMSFGPNSSHQGAPALESYFSKCFSAGGGIELECCCLTDDRTRCVLEYNVVRWGHRALAPQAGLAVFERDPDGLLSAVRIYDDVQPPTDTAD